MARDRAALPNGGWQTPPSAAPDQDPRGQRGAPLGQRPFQAGPQTAPPAGYPSQPGYPSQNGYAPQPGYPAQHGSEQGHEPQPGYYYPQQRQPTAPLPDPRQGLSALGSGQQQPKGAAQLDYPAYPNARPAPQAPAPQRYAAPQGSTPGPGPAGGFRQPAPSFGAQARQPAPAFTAPRPADPMAAAAGYDQWNLQAPAPHDQGGYDLGNYMPSGAGGVDPALSHHDTGFHADPSMHDPLQQQPEWAMPAVGYDEATHDPAYQATQLGYEQGHAGALEQAYAEDGAEYEVEAPRRGSWAMRIAGAIVVAIGLGYGLAQGYKLVMGSAPEGAPPVVESDNAPTKTEPLDPGGKQFAHTDSKVMGRLGEAPPAGASDAASDSSSESAADSDTDAGGTRKVTTLVVGRDGSIQPPQAPAAPAEPAGGDSSVAVPGVTMFDGFGGQYPQAAATTAAATPQDTPQQQPAAARQPVVVRPPAADAPRVVTASTTPATDADSSGSGTVVAALPPQKPAPTKKAAPSDAAAPSSDSSATGVNGYVVVLASVPASGGSRLVALKKFADMQQQYGSVLQNKTPDVREANLGDKGIYHRLLVGPPGSRAQASALCGELKQAGYKDCWVTAY